MNHTIKETGLSFNTDAVFAWPTKTSEVRLFELDKDGAQVTTVYERGLARLGAHEIGHLDGLLYLSRMRPSVEPLPVEEYRQSGHSWAYDQ
ncbi:peptide deformylase [Streptomyces sp. NPDC127038]|uniref:peptide deformylase n=1 Tax=Streptomyces sp. NPDC127038 TaxID=3347114 RepID=UPI003658395B